jgi:hypothetical protein
MHSKRSERDRLAPWLVGFLFITAAAATWPALAQRLVPGDLALLAALGTGLALIWRWMFDHPGYRLATLLVFSAALGHLGFLLGLAVDFGPAGLLMLASWCSSQDPGGWSSLAAMIDVAPFSHLGMLFGCNLGMLLAGCGRLFGEDDRPPLSPVFVVCNLGMLIGMFLSKAIWPIETGMSLSTIGLLTATQMSIGMLSGMMAALLALSHLGGRRLKQSLT